MDSRLHGNDGIECAVTQILRCVKAELRFRIDQRFRQQLGEV
jgi:hypothetical protein